MTNDLAPWGKASFNLNWSAFHYLCIFCPFIKWSIHFWDEYFCNLLLSWRTPLNSCNKAEKDMFFKLSLRQKSWPLWDYKKPSLRLQINSRTSCTIGSQLHQILKICDKFPPLRLVISDKLPPLRLFISDKLPPLRLSISGKLPPLRLSISDKLPPLRRSISSSEWEEAICSLSGGNL